MTGRRMHYTAIKLRIYPTADQISQLNFRFGAARWVYNACLSENLRRYADYKENGKTGDNWHLNYFDLTKFIKTLKDTTAPWLTDAGSKLCNCAAKNLDNAFNLFFAAVKRDTTKSTVGFPKFKSKKSGTQTFTTNARVRGGKLFIVKMKKPLSIAPNQAVADGIYKSTVSTTSDGKYYISLESCKEFEQLPKTNRQVGLDVGISRLCTTSDGHAFTGTRVLIEKTNRSIKNLHRILSRKKQGSHNYRKTKKRLAAAYQTKSNIIRNYLHSVSSWLVKEYDAIYVESLDVHKMTRMAISKQMAVMIMDSAWGRLFELLQYKSERHGRLFHKINKWSPTTKKCSDCGYVTKPIPLHVRSWSCPNCTTTHDRDLNAAINILNTGQAETCSTHLHSDATAELGEIPPTLEKLVIKIERSLTFSVD